MLDDAYQWRGTDHERYRALLKSARHWWMQTKQIYWSNYVASCVKDKKHFNLINTLARKGKIWDN
jgi:hypothetical protein